MSHKLLPQMAFTAIKKNHKDFFSYIFVGAFSVLMNYILITLSFGGVLEQINVRNADIVALLIIFGEVIVALFSVIFVLYANKFVMRKRKKEMALYEVLGLSKRNISVILGIESFVTSSASIVLGVITGAVLNKLAVAFLCRLMKLPVPRGFIFSSGSLLGTVIFFVIVFMICFISNVCTLRFGKTTELLKSENLGEKEPKTKMVLLILGLITMGFGYCIALNAKNASDSLSFFFPSVFLVAIGTYCLFISGTILILKLLKNNKKFYYKPKNFVSVSNLMFRMKHNAVGLASICILSTAVIMLVTCTSALGLLGEYTLNNLFCNKIVVYKDPATAENFDEIFGMTNKVLDESGIKDAEVNSFMCTYVVSRNEDGNIVFCSTDEVMTNWDDLVLAYFITQDDYNKNFGDSVDLEPGQVLVSARKNNYEGGEKIVMYGKEFTVEKPLDDRLIKYIADPSEEILAANIVYVVRDEDVIKEISSAVGEEDCDKIAKVIVNGDSLTDEQCDDLCEKMRAASDCTVRNGHEQKEVFVSLHVGIFFVGVFLAAMFLVGVVMIVYYKQMSEGREDMKRYEILYNAGLTEKEAKASIKSQVLLMFFLPIGTAIVHMIVARTLLMYFFKVIIFVDESIFNAAFVISCIAFFALYALVYKITSSQYYENVYGKRALNHSL
ncbi:MAG: ABC transporter permease [Butyrivibrio sp.]|nr:ABC transporter permease [Butyrivibrio sp.]